MAGSKKAANGSKTKSEPARRSARAKAQPVSLKDASDAEMDADLDAEQ